MGALDNIYFVDVALEMNYEKRDLNPDEFLREFTNFAKSDEDPLGEWIRLAKARGETKESDPVVLAILLDLHRKVEALERTIKGEQKKELLLKEHCLVSQIGYEHIRSNSMMFEVGAEYYARIKMPAFPMREIPIFFEAVSGDVGKVVIIHEHDKHSWDSYTASRERVMIRQKREQR